jgi:sarcosine oxidase, subunit alpha
MKHRVDKHPIVHPLPGGEIEFSFNGQPISARDGEMISSALYAAGIHIFGHHHRDGGAQGIFCVNGQCSQCTVVADGRAVKSCMVPVTAGMRVESCEGAPDIGTATAGSPGIETPVSTPRVLIVGGGPAGICAAVELGQLGIDVLIVDDKQELGGKLSLQTHNFFGSVKDCYAGARGMDIGTMLTADAQALDSVTIWTSSTVVGVYHDGYFGVTGREGYRLVKPEAVLIATGAREKSLAFPGCDLPGVYGAGAFQTLVNRDLISCSEKLFVLGGGNVGLIGAYHALQAGIDVVGLVEGLPRCGGYKVHEDKIRRLGIPVWTSHTVLRAEGGETLERVVIAQVDDRFQPLPGTERAFDVDTLLIAVGLSPVDELKQKSEEYGIRTYSAGDAHQIAEASAAIFSGKIIGRKIAADLGTLISVPGDWQPMMEILESKPGPDTPLDDRDHDTAVFPVLRCVQEIPCNPCTEACPHDLITMENSILSVPEFSGLCQGCGECVVACPGLAITLVMNDYDPSGKKSLVMLPFEFNRELVPFGKVVVTTGMVGEVIGEGKVIALRERADQDRRQLLLLEVPEGDKLKVAGFQIREPEQGEPAGEVTEQEDPIVCRCERVRKSEIVAAIRDGVRDLNQLKAVTRVSMGGCGGKTCTELVLRIYREEGVDLSEVTMGTVRPLVAEIPLGDFVSEEGGGGDEC